MKVLIITFALLAGCTEPTVEEFKAAQKKCAEINRVAAPFGLTGEIRCCSAVDCGVSAK